MACAHQARWAGVGRVSPLPCHLPKTSAVAPAGSPPYAGLSDAPSPALRPGAGYRQWPGGPPLCPGPLGGLNLSGSSPWPSSVHCSLTRLPAHTGLGASPAAWTALALDSGRRRFRDAGHPGAGLATPGNTSRLSLPTSCMPVWRLPWERVGQGSAARGAVLRELGAWIKGAQLPLRPRALPSRALGYIPFAAKEHWKEDGKIQ